MIERLQIQLLAIALSGNDWAGCAYIYASVTKKYNLVPAR